MRGLALVVIVCLAGCASTPPVPAAAPKAAPAAAPSSAAPTAAAPALMNEQAAVKQALAMGYKQAVMNGNTVYCRDEAVIGTRFPQRTCMSANELYQAAKTREASQDLWSHQTLCGGGGVSCGSK